MINIFCAMIIGFYLGYSITALRLDSFEAKRLVEIEKDTDMLTGLFNRRKLFEGLADYDTDALDPAFAIFMVDIDHFKGFNDQYGHVAGDLCLKAFGDLSKEFSKDYDMVFYRYGSEEFMAVLSDYGKVKSMDIAEDLLRLVQAETFVGHKITISIGATFCEGDIKNYYGTAIGMADDALYEAKNSGRNRVYIQELDI